MRIKSQYRVRSRGSNIHSSVEKGPRMRVLLLLGCFTALASSNSCRHSSYTDTTNPNRMKLGFCCVDTSSWTTAADGSIGSIDGCTTWGTAGGGFYLGTSNCQSLAVYENSNSLTSVQAALSVGFTMPSALRLSVSLTTGSSVNGGLVMIGQAPTCGNLYLWISGGECACVDRWHH